MPCMHIYVYVNILNIQKLTRGNVADSKLITEVGQGKQNGGGLPAPRIPE